MVRKRGYIEGHNVQCVFSKPKLTTVNYTEQAHVDRYNSRGESALTVACRHGHQNVTLFLLENGADPNLRSTNGHTAVHEACRLIDMIELDV